MKKQNAILLARLNKLGSQLSALIEYKNEIDKILLVKNIFDIEVFQTLNIMEKALLDAYLKRFSSIQDFLGAKIFPLLLEVSGIGTSKMSEVLNYIAKEEIIDSLENWIEMRETRNDLEHDYPDNIESALNDLKKCLDLFSSLKNYTDNSISFAKGYLE
ncbi:hypothetical protein EW093_13335 [Thiospirochaeta perfilievii]|uniref:DUF86 domain-containing protein n=1 Tax=Thiospirochaeta perfilievii TaxID=252967 RepID=A0A5C1QC38_9SPIO|nr:hypothetical protein [Thiospirochaeta perfilievii]QEN05653.1 hypothetical protein EW093_13335 [Thiospirochaeta perfilievii]